jgi:sugar phosphate isomerase/epimerase
MHESRRAAAQQKEIYGMADLGRIGAQSYSFRKFNFEGALDQLEALGLRVMEFCAVHFPADPADPGFGRVLETLRARGVLVPSFGVEGFTADRAANRRKFELGRALGVECLTADPEPGAFCHLEELVDEFGIRIAIHNHGPGARYDKAADTLRAVDGRHPFIGACVDTGHCVRSGERPADVIAALGPRVLSVHLKDWKTGGEETILGEGDADLPGVATALRAAGFSGPVIMEYENSPDGPVADMRKGLELWNRLI